MRYLRQAPTTSRERIVSRLNERERAVLNFDWRFWARPDQLTPSGEWDIWLLLGGRGAGKTRSGAEHTQLRAMKGSVDEPLMIVAPTVNDARSIMIDGPSGIRTIAPPWFRPKYESSNRRLVWPNGVYAFVRSADEPERLRGPNFSFAWLDELCAWRRLRQAFENIDMGLRLGDLAQMIITTTPKPVELLREIVDDPLTVISRESTYANVENLSDKFRRRVVERYEGTAVGRQELHAHILDKPEGTLFPAEVFSERLRNLDGVRIIRVVVAVDPSGDDGSDSGRNKHDMIGIAAAGLSDEGKYYLLGDYSMHGSPAQWAREVVRVYDVWNADTILAEINFGGAMVKHTIQTAYRDAPVKVANTSLGKYVRAEPISHLYEQGRVHHVGPPERFVDLEDELGNFVAGEYVGDRSPNRADAAIWALLELSKQLPGAEDEIGSGGSTH